MKFISILISASVAALALFQAASAMTASEFIEAISVPVMLKLSNTVASKIRSYENITLTQEDLAAAAEYIDGNKNKFEKVLENAEATIASVTSNLETQGMDLVAEKLVNSLNQHVDYNQSESVELLIDILVQMSRTSANLPKEN